MLEISLAILSTVLLIGCVWMARTLYRLGVLILKVQDTLEESLEVIDERVESVDKILEIPLFSDSPEIKRLQKDMTACRDSLLDIAYSLSSSMNDQAPSEKK